MKQNITKEQWDEIDKKDEFLEAINSNVPAGYIEMSDSNYPNIGQLIEFLGEEWIMAMFDNEAWSMDLKGVKNSELCDTLWEACKNKLK
jgi:hypothetical protein